MTLNPVDEPGDDPGLSDCKTDVLPLSLFAQITGSPASAVRERSLDPG